MKHPAKLVEVPITDSSSVFTRELLSRLKLESTVSGLSSDQSLDYMRPAELCENNIVLKDYVPAATSHRS